MKFCPKCNTKLKAVAKNAMNAKKCSKCNVDIEKYNLELKIINEWNLLFEIYLIRLCGEKINSLENKIIKYKSEFLEEFILNLGYDHKLVNKIKILKVELWHRVFLNKSIHSSSLERNSPSFKIFMILINNLKKELIKIKINYKHNLISYSTFIPWVDCKNNKKLPNNNLILLKRVIKYHNYEIVLIEFNNMIIQHVKNKNMIFLYVNTTLEFNPWGMSYHTLGNILTNLKKINLDLEQKNNKIIEEIGALTKYGWRAKYKTEVRHDALMKKMYTDGFNPTMGSLKNTRRYMISIRSSNHHWLPVVEQDIKWMQSYPIQTRKIKQFLSSKYSQFQKNHKQFFNKKVNQMLMINSE